MATGSSEHYEDVLPPPKTKIKANCKGLQINSREIPVKDYKVSGLKQERRNARHRLLTYPFKYTLKQTPRMEQKESIGLKKSKIGEKVVTKFNMIKKRFEKLGLREAENDKPSSLIDFLHPVVPEHAVSNDYQSDILRQPLHQTQTTKSKVTRRISKSLTDLTQLDTQKPATKQEHTEDYRVNQLVRIFDCHGHMSAHNDGPVSDDDYLVPATKRYRDTSAKICNDIKIQTTEATVEEQGSVISEKVHTVTLYEDVYDDLFFVPKADDKQSLRASVVEERNANSLDYETRAEFTGKHIQCAGLKEYTMGEVRNVLIELGLEKYADVFEVNRIDGHILSTLTLKDFIEELGLTKLEGIRLHEYIKSGHIPT